MEVVFVLILVLGIEFKNIILTNIFFILFPMSLFFIAYANSKNINLYTPWRPNYFTNKRKCNFWMYLNLVTGIALTIVTLFIIFYIKGI